MKKPHQSQDPSRDEASSFERLPVYERVEQHNLADMPGPPTAVQLDPQALTDTDLVIPINDDGRIDLNVGDGFNELCRRFPFESPHEKTQPQDQSPSLRPHIKPSKTNILMLIVGSQGDVQPFVALGRALTTDGHRVRIATHPHFQSFVETHDLEFFDIGGNPAELMAYMLQNPGLVPRFAALRQGDVHKRRKLMGEMIHASWRACFEPGTRPRESLLHGHSKKEAKLSEKQKDPKPFVADAIIANPPSLAHIHCAEKLGTPIHILFTMPWLPTQNFPHPLADVKSTSGNNGQVNYLSYLLVEGIIWQGLGSIINRFRNRVLELDPIHPSRAPTILQSLCIPHTFCWSPSLLSKPDDWRSNVTVSGYLFDEFPTPYTPPISLHRFLDAGPPPVYVGFGSIVVNDPESLTKIVIEAIRRLGKRAIISAGWSSLGQVAGTSSSVASDIFIMCESCPHDWLFPQVSCVVHHGGAGTTAAGLRAGRPTVIVPFFGDQFFWGNMIHGNGAGPAPIPYQSLTEVALVEAVEVALRPDVLERAERLGHCISQENGVQNALQSLYSSLPTDKMACTLDCTRVAVWRSKSTEISMSAVAATVLRKENLVDWNDLVLNRTIEHNVSKGPFEPVSGAAWAVTELLLDSFRGMGEILFEVRHTPMACHGLLKRLSNHSKQKKLDQSEIEEAMLSKEQVTVTEKISVQNPVPPRATPASTKRHKLLGEYFLTGAARIGKAAVRAPGTFTAAMAQGAHNMPQMWGDSKVRPVTNVTGIGSGAVEGCKELVLGVYDGISGVFTQPIYGLIEEGPTGFVKGVGKGVLGLPVKFFAAASGIVGFPLKGIDVAVSHAFNGDGMKAVRNQRMLQGEHEYLEVSEQTKREIIMRWRDLTTARSTGSSIFP